MMEMQRQMMQQFGWNEGLFQGDNQMRFDTSFSFRWDTTFSDGNGSFFFRLGPQGIDTSGRMNQGMFPDMGSFFDDFFKSFDLPQQNGQWYGFPDENQNMPESPENDGLLPEERLRKEEDTNQKSPTQPATPNKKPKLKTIRI
jgi:hypothetical protein